MVIPKFFVVSMPYQSNSLGLITLCSWDGSRCPRLPLRWLVPRTLPHPRSVVAVVFSLGLAYAVRLASVVSQRIARHDLICRYDVFPWVNPFICIYYNVYLIAVLRENKISTAWRTPLPCVVADLSHDSPVLRGNCVLACRWFSVHRFYARSLH